MPLRIRQTPPPFLLAGGFGDRDHGRNTAAGMSITFGLSTGFVPELFAQLPSFLQPLFSNPLAATTILGIIFYQLFHVDMNLAAWLKKWTSPFFLFFQFSPRQMKKLMYFLHQSMS